MSFSTTLERLRAEACLALGFDRATLSADDETKCLSEIPHLAVERIAHAARWPHLLQNCYLTLQPNFAGVLLPVDFEQFERGDELSYTLGSGWRAPCWTDLGSIRRWRAINNTSDIPTHCAIGETLASLETATATPAAGAGTFSAATGFSYRWIARDSLGRLRVSAVASSGTFASKASVGVSGWGTDAGTVSLFRSKDGGATFYAINAAAAINAATTTSYADSTADASLGDPLRLEPSVSATVLGRHWLELFPTPSAVQTLTSLYRRAPRSMSAESDLPDMPLALHRACLLAVRIVAREEYSRPVPVELENALAAEIARVAPPLLNAAPQKAGGLCDVRGRQMLPTGRNMTLASDWGSA